MDERIEFPDIEDIIIARLGDETTHTAGVALPSDWTLDSDPFYVVRRTGGPKRNLVVDNPTIVVETYAGDRTPARAAAELARSVVNAMAGERIDGVQVYGVDEFAGPGNLPDPASSAPRYTQTFSVHVRGAAA